jgi:hypothetical protein
MSKYYIRALTIVSIFLWIGTAHAADPSMYDDTYWCRNGLFTTEGKDFALYRVTADKTKFLMDRWSGNAHCPDAAIPECRWPWDLQKGQVVIANKSIDGFVCAYRDGHAGWLPLSDIEKTENQPSANPPLSAWIGTWGGEDTKIRISRNGDHLHVIGTSYWPAKRYVQGRDGPYARHSGSFQIDSVPMGDVAEFTDSAGICSVHAILLGTSLLVSDNGNCGGMNVRFSGVLPRASAPKH